MNNNFARFGRTVVSMVFAGGLSAVAMLAATPGVVNITLPHAVAVGSTTLPSGNYTMTSVELGGDELFVLRPEHGNASVTLQARRITSDAPEATKVEFSTAGNAWHFQKLFIQGESTGFEFLDSGSSEK